MNSPQLSSGSIANEMKTEADGRGVTSHINGKLVRVNVYKF
jgi:hypothetical protein